MSVLTGITCPVCKGEFDEVGRRIPCENCDNTGCIFDGQEGKQNPQLNLFDDNRKPSGRIKETTIL